MWQVWPSASTLTPLRFLEALLQIARYEIDMKWPLDTHTDLLCILNSEWEHRRPFVGQNKFFDAKTTFSV